MAHHFFQQARSVIQQANFALQLPAQEPDRLLSHYDRLDNVLDVFIRFSSSNINNPSIDAWIETIRRIQQIQHHLEASQNYFDEINNEDTVIIYPIIPQLGSVTTGGRPRFSLPWETISAYRVANFTWTAIAALLQIHPKTLWRHRIEINYEDPSPYSSISNEELDRHVSHIIEQTGGTIVSQFMSSVLLDHGHKVARRRVRESMRRLDILGNADRWATWIPRTSYSVHGPNALWHMDGNMKLKDYGFVLHSSIDGYSRRIIYLQVNTNNRAATVLEAFLSGIQALNVIPERIRTDKGGENRDVVAWMLIINGTGTSTVITGRSVHNQRIERLWRDVNRWLTVFHLVFLHLQQNNIYDSDNEIDKFTLIFVYYPLMQRSLHQFARIWNHHKLRTEHHRSPIQLYADGNPQSLSILLNDAEQEQYGIDWDGPIPYNLNDEEITVIIEPPNMPLTDQDWGILVGHFQDQLYPE